MEDHQDYYVYILRCADRSYYVGYAQDIEQRLRAHSGGRAAPYTARRLPVHLAYSEKHESIESARRRELQLKRWSRRKKEALFRRDVPGLKKMSKRRIV
jgi:predicted GIY-YIG superfamily endonuclease